MKENLINQPAPFGVVINNPMFPGEGQRGVVSKTMPKQTEIPNNGHTENKSYAGNYSESRRVANEHRADPFFWTGRPEKS